jgi:hypothetical protein
VKAFKEGYYTGWKFYVKTGEIGETVWVNFSLLPKLITPLPTQTNQKHPQPLTKLPAIEMDLGNEASPYTPLDKEIFPQQLCYSTESFHLGV